MAAPTVLKTRRIVPGQAFESRWWLTWTAVAERSGDTAFGGPLMQNSFATGGF
jgi:hypothetical protein